MSRHTHKAKWYSRRSCPRLPHFSVNLQNTVPPLPSLSLQPRQSSYLRCALTYAANREVAGAGRGERAWKKYWSTREERTILHQQEAQSENGKTGNETTPRSTVEARRCVEQSNAWRSVCLHNSENAPALPALVLLALGLGTPKPRAPSLISARLVQHVDGLEGMETLNLQPLL